MIFFRKRAELPRPYPYPVIFLDFDGCLNSLQEVIYHQRLRRGQPVRRFVARVMYRLMVKGPQAIYNKWKWFDLYYRFDLLSWWFYIFDDHHDFCPISCSNIQYMLEESPEARIVVSSVWRSHSMAWLKRILAKNGIDPKRVVGRTGREKGVRGVQIKAFVDKYKIKRYVIIDDDRDMRPIMKKLVHIKSWHGIQIEQAKKALHHLNGTCGWCKGKGRSRWTKQYGKGVKFRPPCPFCGGHGYRKVNVPKRLAWFERGLVRLVEALV